MFTFEIARAPLDAPVVRENLQTLDGLSVTEAIRLGHVKTAPYTVKACRYTPTPVASAHTSAETDLASWYGEATRRLPGAP